MKKTGLLLAVLLATTSAIAQIISGNLATKSGEKLAGASLALYHKNAIIQTTISNADGAFKFQLVQPKTYQLKISYVGYKVLEEIVAVENNNITLNLFLEPITNITEDILIKSTRLSAKNAGAFTNLDKKEIAESNFGQDLPFLLNLTPSVVVNSDAGNGIGYTGIRIRGTDPTRTNVTINGIPVNDAESHGVFWVNMPDLASSIQSIQVQRGVGTSTNGAASFGASINIASDKVSEKPFAEINQSLGSFNTFKSTINAGTGLLQNGTWLNMRLSKINSDGFIDRGSSDLKSFFISGGYNGKKSLLKANIFSGKEITYQAWNGIPQAKLFGNNNDIDKLAADLWLSPEQVANLKQSGNRTFNEFTYKNQTDNYQQDHYQLFYTYQFSDKWLANIGAHYTYGRGYYEEFKPQESLSKYKLNNVIIGSDTIKTSDIIRRRWLDNDFYGMVFSTQYQTNPLQIIIGGGINQYDGRHFGEIIWAQYASNAFINDRFYEGKSLKTDANVYIKANWKPKNNFEFFIDLQGRNINYKLNGEDLNGSNYIRYGFNQNYLFFNPKAGATFIISQHTNVYATAGIANREPVRNDIIQAGINSIPKHETLYDYEAGLRTRGVKWAFNLNLFYMNYTNQLVTTGQINDVGAYNRVNVPESYRAGIELTGGVELLKKINWQATLTLSRNKIKQFTEYVDNWDNGTQQSILHNNTDLSFSPNAIASSIINYNIFKPVQISLISKYVSTQFLDNTQNKERSLRAFFVNDIRLWYRFEPKVAAGLKHLQLGVLVNNIFNTAYEPNGYTFSGIINGNRTDFNYYYPQAGRNFLFNIQLSF